ncbi:hypothetical protein CBM2605_B50045 [Cupriavidus neocaledonicus]|uniref:Transposase n=1 Tax=Cupriavidus neocaledonicus TaxID=1040979 RepID=A0ABY1VB88_9BURK|nr:hypothetical protein CBM2605_B50045 [Cupriavidus neocaledonicus]
MLSHLVLRESVPIHQLQLNPQLACLENLTDGRCRRMLKKWSGSLELSSCMDPVFALHPRCLSTQPLIYTQNCGTLIATR